MSNISEKAAHELFGSGEPPKTTREKLLYTALELFYVHGFHAIGIDRIIADVGVTKTTFYNHFESKDELAVEALRLRDQWESESFMKEVQSRAGFDPKAMLLAVFDVLDDWFNHPDYHGCIFINACAEFPSPNDPVHQAALAHYARSRDQLQQVARGAGVDDPEALADAWTVLIQGAITCRLVTGDNEAARRTKRLAEQELERRLAKS